MKTRNGFVSNSSSSSFIILGVSLTKPIIKTITENKTVQAADRDELFEYFYEYEGYEFVSSWDSKENGSLGILGLRLAGSSDYSMESSENSLDSLVDSAKKISANLGISLKHIKLFTGESYS